MGGQPRASGANSPDVASKPLGERIDKLLELSSRSRWRRSNYGNLLPWGLLGKNLHLAILRLLIAMICIVGLPTQIGVCRINGGLDVSAGDSAIDEVSKRCGSDGPKGAGAGVILVGVWRWVLQEGAERSEVPSEDPVVALDRADVHPVADVIFGVERDSPVCLFGE